MATFQVPQFIDQKPKIVGPLTLRQFIILVSAAGISLFSFYTFAFFLWILITLFVGIFAVALAFIKLHGQDLSSVFFHAFRFFWRPRLYTWQREVFSKTQTIDTSALERLETLRRQAGAQAKLNALRTFITTRVARSKDRIRAEQERPKFQTVERITGEEEVARKVDY